MKTTIKSGGAGDRSIVNVHDDYELKYWIQVFDVTESQLASAVKAVGTSSIDVGKYIRSKIRFDSRPSA